MIGDKIKDCRIKRNMTQQDLANSLSVAKSTIGMWENDKREPDLEMVLRIAGLFNCSVDYLIGRDESMINDDVLDRVNVLDQDALVFYGNVLDVEKENDLIKKYRALDEYGREAVSCVANAEARRCEATHKPSAFTFRRFSENKVSAGGGFDLNDPDQWKEIEVIDTPEARMADFAVEIEGRSMEPDYFDGDIVYIALTSEVPIGQVGLFIQNGKGYIKEAGKGCIVSRNPEYNDIFPSDGDIECKGRVIGIAQLAK